MLFNQIITATAGSATTTWLTINPDAFAHFKSVAIKQRLNQIRSRFNIVVS